MRSAQKCMWLKVIFCRSCNSIVFNIFSDVVCNMHVSFVQFFQKNVKCCSSCKDFVRFNIWKTVTTFVYSATQYCCVSINEICVQAARFRFYFLLDIIFWLSSKFLADNSGDFFATRRAFNQYLFITRPPLNPK